MVEPALSVSPETVIVWPETETEPALEVVYPFALAVVEGALHPAGTTSRTAPLEIPPAAAVYVNVSVLLAEPFATTLVGVVSVPVPSAALTVTLGDAPRLASDPLPLDFSFADQVWEPVLEAAVAPGPAPLVSPYVIVAVAPPASVSPDTVIVWPATETLPALEVV